MSKIETVYKNYFQKSKVFMYPLLEIKRGVSVTPIKTYCSWEDNYTQDDGKLIALYHLREDQEFKLFEQQKLLGNQRYHDYIHVTDKLGIYIFDFVEDMKCWKHFIAGKYSKLAEKHKVKILDWCGKSSANYGHIESYLYPERYFSLYAELMGERESLLREVGQLCDPPNIDKETLLSETIALEVQKK